MTAREKEKLYTLRWYINQKWGEESAKEKVLELLGELLEENLPEEREGTALEGGQNLKWYPLAETSSSFGEAITQGSYRNGYPKGAVVHFTAGRRNGLQNGFDIQRRTRMCYFLIDQDGNVGQNFSLEEWGSHAGRSSYTGLSGRVSDELVGIEVMCGGKLEKHSNEWKTWFGERVPSSNRRSVRSEANREAGTYEAYTPEQEEALTQLILWLHRNNPEIFKIKFVVGHDEVSPGRKNDPGGSLSMTMPAFREHLNSLL